MTKFADEVINVVDHLEGDELLYGNATGAQLGWKTKGLSNGPTPTDSASGSVSGSRSPDGLETGLANGFADGLADGLANGLANETKDPELKKTE